MRANLIFFLFLAAAWTCRALSESSVAAEGNRYVIIHADDAGMSHSANRATIDAMEQGIVSSASIMVPCPWFKEIAAYAKSHPNKDFGIHLTLNSEWDNYRWGPVTSRDKVPSLVDQEGYLWDNVEQVAKNAKVEEVATELRAQVQRALDFGVPVTHVDTHMGALVSRPDLIDAYVKVGLEFNVPVFFLRDFKGEVEDAKILDRARRLIGVLDQHKLPVLDYMTQLDRQQDYERQKQRYLEALKESGPGVRYLIIHCGYNDDELQAITASSEHRDMDRRIFTDAAFMEDVKKSGVRIVTWKQVREILDTKPRQSK